MKILIADDDPLSRRLLEATLARCGHDVVALSNGAEAASALLAPDGPRLAILDWMMPNADGLEVCRKIRQRPVPYVYIIMLTSRDRREDMLTGLDAEADDFLTKPFDAVELSARVRSGARVLDLQERLLQMRAALQHEASHDSLTGLWNRSTMLAQFHRELHRALRESTPLAVVLADIDHFKRINDSHGHLVGDRVLQEAAARLRRVMRDYEWLGRHGGEEFLLLLPGCRVPVAMSVAERARAAIASSPIVDEALIISVTVSCGVSGTDVTPPEADGLIRAADQALYRAKSLGRNRVVAFAPDLLTDDARAIRPERPGPS
jgi:diguanylate cyclase (GGDEF)-like protein